MEHLTKQQIVLLTLFTSFVTSIATGIVTVALMDQAPASVTGTINNVIERTIEEVVPSAATGTQSAAVANSTGVSFSNPADQIAYATAVGQKSVVRIMLGNNVTGIGLVVASSGIIMSDKSAVAVYGNYIAVTASGTQYPLQLLQSQNNGDIVFLLAGNAVSGTASSSNPANVFIPVSFAPLVGANAPQLGETVIALSGTDTPSVNESIIEKIDRIPSATGAVTATSTISFFGTGIDSSDIIVGSPLFDAYGDILGVKTLGSQDGDFYPAGYLQSVIPSL